MRKVFTAADPVRAHVVKDILSDNIPAIVQGAGLVALRGEIPFHDAWPCVMISDEADFAKALKIVKEFESAAKTDSDGDWTCPVCGERIGGQFSECWKCAPNPEQARPLLDATRRNTNLLLRLGLAFVAAGLIAGFFGAQLKNVTGLTISANMGIAGFVLIVWGLVTVFRNDG